MSSESEPAFIGKIEKLANQLIKSDSTSGNLEGVMAAASLELLAFVRQLLAENEGVKAELNNRASRLTNLRENIDGAARYDDDHIAIQVASAAAAVHAEGEAK